MTVVSPVCAPSPINPLYCKPRLLTNPSSQGERVEYEKKVFTEWINQHLQQLPPSVWISDLKEALADGITLLNFVHQIAFEAPPCIHRVPALYVHRLENTEACLSFLERLGVDVSGVYAEDVVRGNIKTILALCRAMYIRFEGYLTGDHHCLSPVLSWKQKSPSSSLGASLSPELQFPWKQGEDDSLNESYPCSALGASETAATETSPDSSIFTVWYKEDMAVIGWIRRLLGQELKDYSVFADGILLCAIVNQLWTGSITQEEVLYSTPRERLEIATETAEHFLGVPRTGLDIQAVSARRGRDVLPWYLLELKAASEHMHQEHRAAEDEKNRSRDEEETVNRMRRCLIRQHNREKALLTPSSPPAKMVLPTSEKPTSLTRGGPQNPRGTTGASEMERSPQRGHCSSERTDEIAQMSSRDVRRDGRKDCISEMPKKSVETWRDAERIPLPDDAFELRPAPHLEHIPDASASSASQEDETLQAVEQLETSLASLIQQEASQSPSSDQGEQDDSIASPVDSLSEDVPLVATNLQPSLTAPPRNTPTPSVPKTLAQPNMATFFSPFSMPFVSVDRRRSPAARFDNPSRNSSSSVVEDDSLTRGKLTSWSDKNVRDSQNRVKPSKEPILPRKPADNISATMLARLAARSPGGLAGVSSSESDDD